MARKKRHRLTIQVRIKVPRTQHPEKLAQAVREALDGNDYESLSKLKMAKIDWAHPDDADSSWTHGKREDFRELFDLMAFTSDHVQVGVVQQGSHTEQRKTKTHRGYYYVRRDAAGRFSKHGTRRRVFFDRYEYEDFEVPDFEIQVDYDY